MYRLCISQYARVRFIDFDVTDGRACRKEAGSRSSHQFVYTLIIGTEKQLEWPHNLVGIDKLLKKGRATTIEFPANKVGTFPFDCSHFCGMGHAKMKGQLVVEE